MADISLVLDPTSPNFGDFLIIDGDFVLTSDVDPRGTNNILQDIFQRLRTFLGEWFLDTSNGVPWLQEIFVKGVKQTVIDSIIQSTITSTPGVVMLTKYTSTLNRQHRNGTIFFSALTANGQVDYTLPLGAIQS